MYKLIAVTCAALYGVLLIFGDEARRPAEVTRAEPLDLPLINAAALPSELEGPRSYVSERSDRDAVEMAIAAGKTFRENRRLAMTAPREVAMGGGSDPVAEPAAAPPEIDYWYVTGTRVNLRGGPGTGSPVVGQVTFGAAAEVLASQDGWYQIRLAEGSASGWIFGKFLDTQRPG